MHRGWLVFAVALALAGAGLNTVAAEIDAGNAAYDAGDFAKAAAVYRDLASRGDPEAEMRMGMLYQFGQSVARDYAVALQWYEKSAAQGNAEAQRRLENLRSRMGINARRNEDIAREAEAEDDGRRSGAVLNFTGQVVQGIAPAVSATAATAQSRAQPGRAATSPLALSQGKSGSQDLQAVAQRCGQIAATRYTESTQNGLMMRAACLSLCAHSITGIQRYYDMYVENQKNANSMCSVQISPTCNQIDENYCKYQ